MGLVILKQVLYFAGAGAVIAAISARMLTLSAVGKSAGTFCVTFPVAAHSVPR
jgi:hypothetical protein